LITKDSTVYYNSRTKQSNIDFNFYKRSNIPLFDYPKIKSKQLKLLDEMRNTLQKQNTNIKIVISPLYNQKIFNQNDKKILISYFGKENVYDFSGVNKYTECIGNYYESSHYKPNVANEILKIIYNKQ
jgi:hypothetical protein